MEYQQIKEAVERAISEFLAEDRRKGVDVLFIAGET